MQTILYIPQAEILGAVGVALLQIKNARRLTLEDMGASLGRSREMIAQYIAGEAEMGFVTWLRACAAWPELTDKLATLASPKTTTQQEQGK